MQLSIPFDYPEQPKQEKILEEHILKEFQQGNFSKALETRLTSEEITDILLQRHDTPERLKINILKYMIKKCNNKEISESFQANEETIIDNIRKHNDEVRDRLRQAFNAKDPEILKKFWLEKFWKFNNRYRKDFGGQSIKEAVANRGKGWHSGAFDARELKEKMQKERIQRISKCIEKIKRSTISSELKLLEQLKNECDEKEFDQALTQSNLSEEEKQRIKSHFQIQYISERLKEVFEEDSIDEMKELIQECKEKNTQKEFEEALLQSNFRERDREIALKLLYS